MTTQSLVARAEKRDKPKPMAEVVPISDRALLEGHLKGDSSAFAQLMKIYASPVYGTLTRSGIPPSDRDDVFQDVFEKVHRAALKKLPEGPIRAWLFTIVMNTIRDRFRKKKVRAGTKLHEDPARGHADVNAPRPDQVAEINQTARFIDQEIAKLPAIQREALILCAVEGLSLEDASVVFDAPVNTIKTRIRRARLTLADAMRRRSAVAAREEAR